MANLNFAIKLGLMADGLKSGLNSAKSALSGFASSVKSAMGMIAGAFAAGQLKAFGQECLNLYKAQATAETKLATVMKQRMNASDAEVKSILELTSAQQKLGVIGDEVQIAGAQQVSTFLKQKDSLNQLIPAMNNLLAQTKGLDATQGDAVTIGNLMGKAMMGQTSALKKYGISLDEAQEKVMKYGTESQKAAMLAQIIKDNVGDMNSELAKTDLGKIQQMNNILGDTKEQIGAAIAPIVAEFAPKVAEVAVSIANGITSAIQTLRANFETIATQLIVILASIKIAGWVKNVVAMFQAMQQQIVAQTSARAAAVNALEAQILSKKVAIENMKLQAAKKGLTEESAYYAKIKQQERALEDLNVRHHKAAVEARLARLRAYHYQNASIFGKMGMTIAAAFRGVGTAMKAAFSTVWPMLLVTAIMECVTWIGKMVAKSMEATEAQKKLKQVAEETANIQAEGQKEVARATGDVVSKFKILQKQWGKLSSLSEQTKFIKENKSAFAELGLSVNSVNEAQRILVKNAPKVIAALKAVATAEAMKDAYKKAVAEKAEKWTARHKEKKTGDYYTPVVVGQQISSKQVSEWGLSKGDYEYAGGQAGVLKLTKQGVDKENSRRNQQAIDLNKKLESIYDESIDILSNEWQKAEQMATQAQKAAGVNIDKSLGGGGTVTGGTGKGGKTGTTKQTPAEKAAEHVTDAQTKYSQSIEKAKMRLDNGLDDQEAYEKKVYSALETLYTAYSDAYADSPEQKYKDAMLDCAEKLKAQGKVIEQATDELDKKETLDNFHKTQADIAKNQKPRDTTFDYRLGKDEKMTVDLEFQLEQAKAQLDELKQYAESGCKEAIDAINDAQNNVTDITTKLNLEKVKQDVQSLQKELAKGWQDFGTEAWQAVKGTVDGINSMIETMNDPDASGWEKFCSVIDTLINLFQTVQGVMTTVNTIMELSTTLKKANAAASQQEALASGSAAMAKAGETTANATASGAKLPFPANIAAIAAGVAAGLSVVSTIISILGSFKDGGFVNAYASGGFIQGAYTSGDRNLIGVARVNAGEAILNPSQQRNFMRIANGQGIASGTAGGGKVKFEIEGRKLVGVLSNETTRSGKIR